MAEQVKAKVEALAAQFFEWPGEDKRQVTTTSCLLFAEHCVGVLAGEWAAMSQDDGKAERAIERLDERRRELQRQIADLQARIARADVERCYAVNKMRADCAKVCEDLQAPESFTPTERSLWDAATLACEQAIKGVT